MHIVTLILYSTTIWLGMMLFAALSGEHLLIIFLLGPFIVSGVILLLASVGYAADRIFDRP